MNLRDVTEPRTDMSRCLAGPIVHQGVPGSVKALIWEVFFASRGRGIALSVHFPWMDDDQNVRSISIDLTENRTTQTVAALVLKPARFAGSMVGLLGLVCVAAEQRGRGLSSLLIEAAVEAGLQMDWRALVLWTQVPDLYARYGFNLNGNDVFAAIGGPADQRGSKKFRTRPWPWHGDARGLPAFSSGATRIITDRASVIVLETTVGAAVAEWSGDDVEVADLLHASLPDRWSLNAQADDTLIDELSRRGFLCTLRPSSSRMVRELSEHGGMTVPPIRILDRI